MQWYDKYNNKSPNEFKLEYSIKEDKITLHGRFNNHSSWNTWTTDWKKIKDYKKFSQIEKKYIDKLVEDIRIKEEI